MRRSAAVLLAAMAAGCGRYADFTLPPAEGALREMTYTFEAQTEPVMTRGGFADVLNPSVVRAGSLYYNLYSAYDGAVWRTRLATSADGTRWTDHGTVLSPGPADWEGGYIAANGTALHQDEFLYWYQAGPKGAPRIGLARSRDGRAWEKHPEPVLGFGPRGAWDERAAADPYVIRAGEYLYLYYLGQDRARRQRLGVARSRDGVRWTRLRANPVLEPGEPGAFDEEGLGEPAVWTAHGWWWMLYTGRDRHENRRLGLARSRDGVNWRKLPAVFSGAQPWNLKVVCDPAVEMRADGVRVWFGGGDAASPDENLHGQIGIGWLRPVNATLAK
ncbi:MAG: hypothetical protein ACE15B_12475 [Bryobacteraceae bacterium]